MDLFVVPTIGLQLLYAVVIVRLDRRDLVWINVTANPTAEWIARQITEAFPWDDAPHYLVRDRDGVYGPAVTRRLRAMGIRDKPIAAGSLWQNGFAERLIGSIRRECTDRIIALGEGSYVGSCDPTHITTTKWEHIDLWTRIRQSRVQFSGTDVSFRMQSLAAFITTMREFRFSVHTGAIVEPMIPPARHGGRKRPVNVREVLMDAIDLTGRDDWYEPLRQWLCIRAL
jgi:transposase InsO family protein